MFSKPLEHESQNQVVGNQRVALNTGFGVRYSGIARGNRPPKCIAATYDWNLKSTRQP
jgi:hypothetical protein